MAEEITPEENIVPNNVTTENTTYGKNASFGAGGWVNAANYHYTDANISLLGQDADGNDKGAGIEFKHKDNTGGGAISQPAGAIIAGKDNAYNSSIGFNASVDSNLQFFTTLNGTDTERLKIDSNGLSIFTGRISASGDIITTGDVIAENYIVSSTVTQITTSFSSGSTIFGDSVDDTHQFTGSVLLGQFVQMTNSSSIINTFNTSSFQTCKYVLQVKSGSHIQSSEMLVMHSGSTAFNTEYAQMNTLNLVNFSTKVVGANVQLIGSSSFISCSVNFVRTLI